MTRTQFKKAFPKALKARRKRDNKTQEQVGKEYHLSQSWVSHFEAGRRLPDAFAFHKLMIIFPHLELQIESQY